MECGQQPEINLTSRIRDEVPRRWTIQMNSKQDNFFDPMRGAQGAFVRAIISNGNKTANEVIADFEDALKDTSTSGVIFFENPIYLMAKHIAADSGNAGASVLELWKKEAEENLAVLRRHRGRVKIVESARKLDDAAIAVLNSAFAANAEMFERAEALDGIDTLSISLAELSFLEDHAAANMLNELRASSTIAVKQVPSTARSIKNIVKEVQSLRGMGDGGMASANSEVAELLSKQIMSLQTSLKTVEQERRRLEERTRAAEKASAESQEALQQILNSTSWKASSPIRMVKKLYTR